jgi:hypothetical protein
LFEERSCSADELGARKWALCSPWGKVIQRAKIQPDWARIGTRQTREHLAVAMSDGSRQKATLSIADADVPNFDSGRDSPAAPAKKMG